VAPPALYLRIPKIRKTANEEQKGTEQISFYYQRFFGRPSPNRKSSGRTSRSARLYAPHRTTTRKPRQKGRFPISGRIGFGEKEPFSSSRRAIRDERSGRYSSALCADVSPQRALSYDRAKRMGDVLYQKVSEQESVFICLRVRVGERRFADRNRGKVPAWSMTINRTLRDRGGGTVEGNKYALPKQRSLARVTYYPPLLEQPRAAPLLKGSAGGNRTRLSLARAKAGNRSQESTPRRRYCRLASISQEIRAPFTHRQETAITTRRDPVVVVDTRSHEWEQT